MLYISTEKNKWGGYYSPQSTYADGLVAIPEELLDEFLDYNGFVSLTVENNVVVAISPEVELWEEWKATQTEPTPTPSAMEQLRADVDYIAIMTGVEL